MAEMWKLIALQIIFPVTCIIVFYVLFNLRRRAKGDDGVPGNMGLPIVGETFFLFASFKNPKGVQSFTESRAKRYGRTFLTNILGKNWVFTSTRDAAKFVLSSEKNLFRFASSKAAEEMLGSNNVSYVAPDLHKKLRRLVGEPISGANLKKNFERIEVICLDILNGWSGKTVSAMDGTSIFAFEVIGHIIASMERGPELSELHKNFLDILDATTSFAIKVPGTSYYRGCKARENFMRLLQTIMDRRRKGLEAKDDFIQSMISKDGLPQEDRLTDLQIKDNCLALLIAGFATTGAALTWSVKFLEENPCAKERLMEEYKRIDEKKVGSKVTKLTWDDIHQMPYTTKVILETLRMSNPVQWSTRSVLQDFSLQGFTIRKDWILAIDHCGLHYDSDIFPNPTKFNPSRFDVSLIIN
ncbi:hypothetical protein SUGI_0042370 [Cryptomeria japonica]|nr:hypothetical protein SUGI_0042370 [Cryptomeria japonica]